MVLTEVIKRICTGLNLEFIQLSPLTGGSINDVYRVDTNNRSLCFKINSSGKHASMFEKEQNGLKELSRSNCIRIPEIIDSGEIDNLSYLVLEYIPKKAGRASDWEQAGVSLAEMHKISADKFGFFENNYMGSLDQSNRYHDDWIDFFRIERLEKQFRLAFNHGYFDSNDQHRFIVFLNRLDNILIKEKACLVHGDLWSGNYFFSEEGDFVLIDPAAYYGNREIDLAMSTLFGSADPVFYKSYKGKYPFEPSWENRWEIYNLYPLLIHVNLFGHSYLGQTKAIINKYC